MLTMKHINALLNPEFETVYKEYVENIEVV